MDKIFCFWILCLSLADMWKAIKLMIENPECTPGGLFYMTIRTPVIAFTCWYLLIH